MILETLISSSNLPNSLKMYLRRYWRNRIQELAKLYTSIAQIVNLYKISGNFLVKNLMTPLSSLGVKNVKIRENSLKIRGPPDPLKPFWSLKKFRGPMGNGKILKVE